MGLIDDQGFPARRRTRTRSSPDGARAMEIGIDAHAAERDGEGNTTYVRNLVRTLLELEECCPLTLFAEQPGHPFYAALGPPGRVRLRRLPPGGGLGRVAGGLGRAARRAGVTVLHVQYFAPLGYRGPVVLTVHDLGFLHVPDSFSPGLRLAMRVLVPWSIRRAAVVIAASEFGRRDLVTRYGLSPERVAVIPLAAGADFRPGSGPATQGVLARYGLEPGFLFALGRLNQRKNLPSLLQAYEALWRRGVTKAPLVLAGKPDRGVREVSRVLRGAAAPVRWVGLLPDEDLPAFYAGAACFVYPSLFEGFGLPLLEAMACGCPVISSDRGALLEVVGDAALLVDPERVESITEAMAQLLSQAELRNTLRERGLARSRQYTWTETARRTLGVYRTVIG